jgi:hypothetical protein
MRHKLASYPSGQLLRATVRAAHRLLEDMHATASYSARPFNCEFTMSAHPELASYRTGLNCMSPQHHLRAAARRDGNVLSLPRPLISDAGETALDLVYQAADVFRGMEERARETEARAQALCKSASEKLRCAEIRAEAAERAQRELIVKAEHKLHDASRALEQAQSRIEAQQDQLTAVEFRAQAAEAEAREAKQALALVEEAIRRRLLSTNLETNRRLTDVA